MLGKVAYRGVFCGREGFQTRSKTQCQKVHQRNIEFAFDPSQKRWKQNIDRSILSITSLTRRKSQETTAGKLQTFIVSVP